MSIPPIRQILLQPGKKIYFASDFHFGIPDYAATRARERLVCQWLDEIKKDAQQIYLLGDVWDSWMEYTRVVPKGSIRFLGKLAELSDSGIELIIFTGNHDLWMRGYVEQELGATVYKSATTFQFNAARIHLAHGDGVCKKEIKYRCLKALLQHPLSQWIYRKLHPDWGLKIADSFSRMGPKHKYQDLAMKADDQEYQIIYAHSVLQQEAMDYFIFGHRHIPLEKALNPQSTFINLGDWISYKTYAVFDGKKASLETFDTKK